MTTNTTNSNIADLPGYLTRMRGSLVPSEKLFFLNELDIGYYDTIIDYGGADGALVDRIRKVNPNANAEYYIVEENDDIKCAYDIPNLRYEKNLNSIWNNFEDKKVLLILSSVLHECKLVDVAIVQAFVIHCVETVVARDMFWDSSVKDVENEFEDTFKLLGKIFENEQYKDQFYQMKRLHHSTLYPLSKLVYEFLLKYTYTANWANEINESYFCNNIEVLADSLFADFKIDYRRVYTLPYKKDSVEKEFGFVMKRPTHQQIILSRR